MITTVRVQEKGQVTIPRAIRKQLNLKKGDLVTFVSTKNGVVIKTLNLAAEDILAELERKLKERGIRLDEVIARSRNAGAETLVREFSLSADERNNLYQAIQLKAQAAVESIRTMEREDFSQDEIDAEILAVRMRSGNEDRS